jgi:hypothetical protein
MISNTADHAKTIATRIRFANTALQLGGQKPAAPLHWTCPHERPPLTHLTFVSNAIRFKSGVFNATQPGSHIPPIHLDGTKSSFDCLPFHFFVVELFGQFQGRIVIPDQMLTIWKSGPLQIKQDTFPKFGIWARHPRRRESRIDEFSVPLGMT